MSSIKLSRSAVEGLLQRLKYGSNTRSTSLNCVPGRSVTKLELAEIDKLDQKFSFNFIRQLLSEEKFKYTLSIPNPGQLEKEGIEDVGSLFEEKSDDEDVDEEKLQAYVKIRKNLQKIDFRIKDEYTEHGTHSFGVGYPVIGIRDRDNRDKYIFAPILIWDLDLEKSYSKKDTYVFSRDGNYFVGVNEVFLGYLEQVFGIRFPQLSEEILDDNIVDSEELTQIVNLLLEKLQIEGSQWEIDGVSSFPDEPKKEIANNPKIFDSAVLGLYKKPKQSIIRDTESILKKYGDLFDDEEIKLNTDSFDHLYSSLDTDPSQQHALGSVSESGGLIIQGPPGTGKSQTLTSLVTNALDNKKKILLVCEKKTAFDVIYENLKGIGLSSLALIIEDVNRDRKKAVNYVRDFVESPNTIDEERTLLKYENLIEDINELVADINSYHHFLDETLIRGLNFSEIVAKISELTHDNEEVDRIKTQFKNLDVKWKFKDPEYQGIIKNVLRATEKYNPSYGKDWGFIRKGFFIDKNFAEIKNGLEDFFEELSPQISGTLKIGGKILKEKNLVGEIIKGLEKQLKELSIDSVILSECKKELHAFEEFIEMPPSFNDTDSLNLQYQKSQEIFQKMKQGLFIPAREIKEDLLLKVEHSKNLCHEMKEISENYFEHYNSSWNNLKINIGRIFLDDMKKYKNKKGKLHQDLEKIEKLFSDFATILEHEELQVDFKSEYDTGEGILELLKQIETIIKNEDNNSIKPGENLLRDYNKFISKINFLQELDSQLNKKHREINSYLKSEQVLSQNLRERGDVGNMKNYIVFFEANKRKTLQKYADRLNFFDGINDVSRKVINFLVESDLEQGTNRENWFIVGYYQSVLEEFEQQCLYEDTDANIEKLKQKLEEMKGVQKYNILKYWKDKQRERLLVFKESKNFTIQQLYNKRGSKGRKRNSLRKILATDFDLFTSFFPVLMVNPQVASSILPLERELFDVVIFDEASQLRLEDTLPCIMRGERVVISGDSQQMPPSSYFTSDPYIELENEEEDIEKEIAQDVANIESLLNFGVEQSLPTKSLDNHYRSEHPDLITFSNVAFYNNRLRPMPPREDYIPIEFRQVNGTYFPQSKNFKGNVNEDEAKLVIKILQEYGERENPPSILVATLNIYQRDLIKGFLESEKIAGSKEGNSWVSRLENSGLLVRNLENIQGDERDVLIISTTFGRKRDGSFSQNFGRLNRSNGNRFLNVLITRAKKRIHVLTSIPEEYYSHFRDEIATKGNVGKGIFYAYLSYAKAISEEDDSLKEEVLASLRSDESNKILHGTESPFEEEVVEELLKIIPKNRIEIQHQCGGFRIDIVIKDKETRKPKYAIECDGASFHSSEVACWEDLHRQKILEKNGFIFFRIWSTDWWMNRKEEIDRLNDFLIEEGQI